MQGGIENNIIITEPSKNLRTLGRNALAGNWKVAILAVLVYTLILQVPQVILDSLFGINVTDLYGNQYYQGMDAGLYSNMYYNTPTVSPLSTIYLLLVSGPLTLGLSLFFLALFRRQLVEVTDIFLGFEKFSKALGLLLYQTLFILLWTLLFIVPGIIAAIRYSQAFFILADDPEKGIRQCMDESKAMMKGNKMKYFCLSISFIGWMFLAAIPTGVVSAMGEAVGADGVVSILFTLVGTLFQIPVVVYMNTTYAGFYEILAGHLIKATEPAPVEPAEVAVPEAVRPILAAEEPAAAEGAEAAQQAPASEAPAAETPAEPAAGDVPVASVEPVVPEAAPEAPVVPEEPVVPETAPEAPAAPLAEAEAPEAPAAPLAEAEVPEAAPEAVAEEAAPITESAFGPVDGGSEE